MNCLDHIRRQKILHCLQPSEAGRRKGSIEYLMSLGSSILTTDTQHGVKKRKDTASVKEAASAALNEPSPKRKKMKVLTHRPRYIEPATVPEFVGETSSATKAKEPTPLPNIEELVIMPEMEKIEEPKAKETRASKILSPSAKVEVPKSQKGPAMTPKRKKDG